VRRVEVARVYDDPDGPPGTYRVLVDRLWPRGVRRDGLTFEEWAKDVAPSGELRRWYGHEPARFAEFARRYQGELREPASREVLERLRKVAEHKTLTLLTATRDVTLSGAEVLRRVLIEEGL